ncbi:sugar phosphate isomerase/epimerase family protein [Paenibacillus hodogayensis]|uniref:Sugar phosphate isomerase/epimerase family protein n=1 Tax=Paenibacillus hodogayensis TaxID=279208 RepID=A0ABV5W7S1_9BACL
MADNESWFEAGVLSVTFRQLSAKRIAELTAQAGLQAIEWGGDIHVPPGASAVAAETARITAESGLRVSGYASYYRTGDEPEGEFDKVLDTALTLGAPSVRVWAGRVGSAEADDRLWHRTVEDARRIGEKAAAHGLRIDLEFHRNTLTDTIDSTIKLMEDIGSPHVRSCWQPPVDMPPGQREAELSRLLPWLSGLHVFHWVGVERLPLREGLDEWRRYLDMIRPLKERRSALLEFVKDDDPEQFIRDAAALKELLET